MQAEAEELPSELSSPQQRAVNGNLLRFEIRSDCNVSWLPHLSRVYNVTNPNFRNWKAWEVQGFGVHLVSPENKLYKFPYSALVAMEYDYDDKIHGPKRPVGRPPKGP